MNDPRDNPSELPSGDLDDFGASASSLDQALSRMTYERLAGRFALLGFARAPQAADLELLGRGPGQVIREGGETTLLIPAETLEAALALHPDANVERDLAWIRFRAPMSWEVVGFLAKVTTAFAAAQIPLGAVCGFSRDHLFIHERFLERAGAVLDSLFEPYATD